MMATVVRMPEVLAGISEAAIGRWLVSAGQEVAVGTPLAEVETEKAVVDYPSEVAGTVLQLLAEEGVDVAIGDPILVVGAPGETVLSRSLSEDAHRAPESKRGADADEVAAASDSESPEPAAGANPEPSPAATSSPAAERRFVSPLVRKLARERGLDLAAIVGTGPNGRIVRRDIEGLAAAPAAGTSDVAEIPLTRMRRAIARRLTESKTTVPHFYLTADIRVDRLVALRAEINAGGESRVSVNDFVLLATARALRAVPDANATWGETVLRRPATVDVAVAVAIDGGLVTPVVREADTLTLSAMNRVVADLAARAREGRLQQHEVEGGSFSVSNLGMYGTQEFAAIINPPHAGILAVGAARQMPVVDDGALAVGTVMTVTLSADHRVLDGAIAAQWLAALVELLESPARLLAGH